MKKTKFKFLCMIFAVFMMLSAMPSMVLATGESGEKALIIESGNDVCLDDCTAHICGIEKGVGVFMPLEFAHEFPFIDNDDEVILPSFICLGLHLLSSTPTYIRVGPVPNWCWTDKAYFSCIWLGCNYMENQPTFDKPGPNHSWNGNKCSNCGYPK